MSIVIFNNDTSTRQEVNLSRSGHVITLELSSAVDEAYLLSGKIYTLNEYNGSVQGKFNGFTTIYRTFDDDSLKYQLSDDGSVYVEPPEPEPTPEPEPYVPTLEEVQSQKISEFDTLCNQSIVNGVDVEIDGAIEHFSYTDEDQANLDDLMQMAKATMLDQPYHSDGNGCKLYAVEQVVTIYIAEKLNKMHHTTYFNQMKMYIKTLEDKDIITAINYGDALTGEYLENYNLMMTQAKKIIAKLVGTEEIVSETASEA